MHIIENLLYNHTHTHTHASCQTAVLFSYDTSFDVFIVYRMFSRKPYHLERKTHMNIFVGENRIILPLSKPKQMPHSSAEILLSLSVSQ